MAWLPRRPSFALQPDEVAELLEPPIAIFWMTATSPSRNGFVRGEPRQVPYYNVAGHKVWGATAMVLAELATVIATIH